MVHVYMFHFNLMEQMMSYAGSYLDSNSWYLKKNVNLLLGSPELCCCPRLQLEYISLQQNKKHVLITCITYIIHFNFIT